MIWIQTVWHFDFVPERFFEWKKSADDNKIAKKYAACKDIHIKKMLTISPLLCFCLAILSPHLALAYCVYKYQGSLVRLYRIWCSQIYKDVGEGVCFADFISFLLNILWKWNNLVSLRPNYFIAYFKAVVAEGEQNKTLWIRHWIPP